MGCWLWEEVVIVGEVGVGEWMLFEVWGSMESDIREWEVFEGWALVVGAVGLVIGWLSMLEEVVGEGLLVSISWRGGK